jgi:hypothetical protein
MSSFLSWFYNATSTSEGASLQSTTSTSYSSDEDVVKSNNQAKTRENESDSITVSSEDSVPSSVHEFNDSPDSFTKSNVISDSTANHSESEAIVQTLHSWEKSWNEGNFDDYVNSYADGEHVRYISSSLMATKRYNGDIVVMGKHAIRNVFQDVFERAKKYTEQTRVENNDDNSHTKCIAGELEYLDIDVQLIRDDQAFVFGRYRYDLGDLQDFGVFTLQMVMIGGKWKILTEHASAMPKRK